MLSPNLPTSYPRLLTGVDKWHEERDRETGRTVGRKMDCDGDRNLEGKDRRGGFHIGCPQRGEVKKYPKFTDKHHINFVDRAPKSVDASAPPYMEAPGDERTETTNVKERNGGKKKLTHRSHRVEGSKNGHIPLCFHLALISLFPLSDT